MSEFSNTNQTTTPIDDTSIDACTKAIKAKLREKGINCHWASATDAEKIIILHIESKLQEIIDFLR